MEEEMLNRLNWLSLTQIALISLSLLTLSPQAMEKEEVPEEFPALRETTVDKLFKVSKDIATNHIQIVGVDYAHEQGIKGKGVKVAIIDSTFSYKCDTEHALSSTCILAKPSTHTPDFWKKFKATTGKVSKHHANHVASIIAGEEIGIAPEAKLKIIDLENDPSLAHIKEYEDRIVKAIDLAIKSGVHFINLSQNIFPENQPEGKISVRMRQSFLAARNNGIGIIKSAGNLQEEYGKTAYTKSLIDLAKDMKGHLIFVSAIEYTKEGKERLAERFSNKPGKDAADYFISAPGVRISARGAEGVKILMSGTSMAAPIVTGVAALIKSIKPGLSAPKIFNILKYTARKTSLRKTYQFDDEPTLYGHGVIDAEAALVYIQENMLSDSSDK
jgi:subtilisin family serine protease